MSDIQTKLTDLEAQVQKLKQRQYELPVRIAPVTAGGTPVKLYKITQLPSGGRKAYRAKPVTVRATGEGPLESTVPTASTSEVKIFNSLEVATTGPEFVFLVVGDEVEVWVQNGIRVCEEIPRGYI